MISKDLNNYDPFRYFRTLGICWVIYGFFRLVCTVLLVFFSNNAAMMFGSLLDRVSDPFMIMNFFHVIYTFVVVLSAVCGALGLLAGWVLLTSQKAGRTLTLVAAFLSLSDIPLGITLGIYSLLVLLPLPAAHASEVVLHDQPSDLEGTPP